MNDNESPARWVVARGPRRGARGAVALPGAVLRAGASAARAEQPTPSPVSLWAGDACGAKRSLRHINLKQNTKTGMACSPPSCVSSRLCRRVRWAQDTNPMSWQRVIGLHKAAERSTDLWVASAVFLCAVLLRNALRHPYYVQARPPPPSPRRSCSCSSRTLGLCPVSCDRYSSVAHAGGCVTLPSCTMTVAFSRNVCNGAVRCAMRRWCSTYCRTRPSCGGGAAPPGAPSRSTSAHCTARMSRHGFHPAARYFRALAHVVAFEKKVVPPCVFKAYATKA